MKTDESDKPKPTPKPQESAWFPGLYRFWAWHRFKGHRVGRSVVVIGGMWDGSRTDTITCYTCDTDWTRTTL